MPCVTERSKAKESQKEGLFHQDAKTDTKNELFAEGWKDGGWSDCSLAGLSVPMSAALTELCIELSCIVRAFHDGQSLDVWRSSSSFGRNEMGRAIGDCEIIYS